MTNTISDLDLGIIACYLLLVVGIGFWVARKTHTGDDLFLGGRSFGWGLIGLSLFASNISSSTIIGLSGAAYKTGIVDSVYEWMSGIPLIVAALIFVPLYLRNRVTTIPEFLEKRYDRRSQLFFSGITILGSVFIEMAGTLYAGTLVLKTFFPELAQLSFSIAHFTVDPTSIGLAVIAALYTASGGLRAVVLTDAVQAVILIVGCSIMTYILFSKLDFDWETVIQAAPKNHLSVIRPIDDEAIPWPGLLIGVPILGFWYWTTNQYIVQRILGAKNIRHARWGVIFAGFLKMTPLFIMVFPGVMAIGLYPNLDNQDMIFPILVTQVLPTGAIGLVLAGLISAILSSVDSALNSASTLVVIDFIKPRYPNLSERQLVRYGRQSTILLICIAALWSPQIANFQGLWSYIQEMFSIMVPPIIVIFLIGVFYKKGNANGAFATLILGTVAGLITFIFKKAGIWEVHYTINVGIMVLLSSFIFVIGSLGTKTGATHKAGLTYTRDLINMGFEGVPWYKHYVFYMVVLLLFIGGIFIWLA